MGNHKLFLLISLFIFTTMSLQNSEIHIFFDDGDVLNDNKIRGRQWHKLIGKYLAPRFGGVPKEWGRANEKVVEEFLNKGVPTLIYQHKEKNHQQFMEWFRKKWINDMFDYMGIDHPAKSDYNRIYYESAEFVDPRVRSAFPGVKKTIKILYKKDFKLHTCSGTESIELKYYLEGMDIKQYFTKFYGPDLINILKVDTAFYDAIFNDLDINPNQAIIIDDKPYYLNFAQSLGTHVVQACLTGEFEPEFTYFIKHMKNLPMVINRIKEREM
jgi:phosphoglycolate phosphatase-like HAD superfamily hydrolase